LISISAAIKNYRGRVIACVSITAPALRVNDEKIKEMGNHAKVTAEKISQSMGFNK